MVIRASAADLEPKRSYFSSYDRVVAPLGWVRSVMATMSHGAPDRARQAGRNRLETNEYPTATPRIPVRTMPSHEQSIVIRRPVAEVFTYMDDISREREWQPQLLEADQTPPGPTAVGSRKRYVSEFMGIRLENTYVVKVYEPNRRLVCESTPDSILNATSDLRWEEAEGGTRVTMALEGKPSGALRFVPGRMLEATFEKEVRTTLARLKDQLEAE